MKKIILGSFIMSGLIATNIYAGVGSPLTFAPTATTFQVGFNLKIEQVRPEAIEHYSTGDIDNWSESLKTVAKEIRKDLEYREKKLSDLEVLELIIDAE